MIAMQTSAMDQSTVAARLWESYGLERSAETRDALICQYAALVKYVVDRLRLSLPPSVDRDDLLGYGTIGLIEAIDRFDPLRGIKFETYAIHRIRGAIIDAVRTMDMVPRRARERARAVENAYRELFASEGKMPSDAKTAAHLGMTIDEFQRVLRESACVVVSIDRDGEEGHSFSESFLADSQSLEPQNAVAHADMVGCLADALGQLSERDRLLVSLYYYEELTMREISEVIGVTESRVSQLLTRTRLQLRVLLQKRGLRVSDVEA